jgi:N6-adenosine-specific RNA methylase IME4
LNDLAVLEHATKMLAQVRNASDAKTLMDMAAAAEYYARKRKLGQDAIAHATDIKTQAKAMLGHYLKNAPKNKGARGKTELARKRGPHEVPRSDETPTLAELGLTKNEAAEAMLLHTVKIEDPAKFEEIRIGEKTVTQVKRERSRAATVEAAKLPSDKFRVLYADPPWKYGDQLTERYGAARFHYDSMTIPELCALPVADLSSDDAVLFLWVTSPMLLDSAAVVKAWGFNYKSAFVWDKVKHNLGHYNSVRHELLLLCTRGRCLPDISKLFDSVVSVERTRHSEKPEAFREIIDALYPHGNRIELFARREVPGWRTWGNGSFPGDPDVAPSTRPA